MKSVVRKFFYFLLYVLIIIGFIYFSKQDNLKVIYENDQEKFASEYGISKYNCYEYVNTQMLIEKISEGDSIIFIGNKDNEWSIKYLYFFNNIVETYRINKVYYFDAGRMKQLQNRNYYEVINALKGNLIETDDSADNLFTPSLYIVKNGKIVYHDSTSSVVKNEDTVESFWTEDEINRFSNSVINALRDNNFID